MTDPPSPSSDDRLTLGVVGLGYVGLPLAVAARDRGLRVIGFDVADDVVRALCAGRSHVSDVSDDALASVAGDALRFTSEPGALRAADAILICVPSPLGRNRQPDTSYIEAAARTVAANLRAGALVSLESTTYPGTTEEIVVPILAEAGHELDRDVFVCFSPERVDPGNPLGYTEIPKVVGGVTPRSSEVGADVYRRFVDEVHVVSSAKAAELTKLLENTYRAVNIAMVNELAQLAHGLRIDIWEVIEAAATKPFGYQPFRPGPGVGGHCIPLDPQYLAWRARELRFATRFIDLADQVNTSMPSYVVARAADVLNELGRPIRGSTVLAVGLAYKPNVGDDRESPAHEVLQLLADRGARIRVLDPLVPARAITASGYEVARPDDLGAADLALVLTDHDGIDYAGIADAVARVLDTRDAYRRRGLYREDVQPL